MEVGQTVVLVNLNNLYESLYDVLNGYHVKLGDKNYVDLGLGTHRVKCAVHPDFRLIVVAEDTEVHNTFPIPLINRLVGVVCICNKILFYPRILNSEGWPVSGIFRHSVVGPHPPPPPHITFLCFELEKI